MAGDVGDPIARRRRIAEKGSDRLALITGRAPNLPSSPPSSSSAAESLHSYPPSDENRAKSGGSESANEKQSSSSPNNQKTCSKKAPKFDLKTYLYKTVSPNQLHPAILASQETRRKVSFLAGIVALLSHVGFPILGSYIIRSIILCRPLLLLLSINVTITVGPLILDAMKLIQQEANSGPSTSASDVEFPDNFGTPFEWGMLFKTGLSAFFMDSCIYSVVVVCGMSILQKFGL